MDKLHTPDQLKSRPTLIGMAALGLVLAYLLATRAFDTGSLWQYLGAAILVVLSVHLIVRSVKIKK